MSHTPLTRRDYERTIKAIVQSRQEVQKLRDAARSDEHFSGALVSVSVPREDNVSVARETNQMEPPLRRDSHVYTSRNGRAKELRWRGDTLRMNA
jgi:hypothetical protein